MRRSPGSPGHQRKSAGMTDQHYHENIDTIFRQIEQADAIIVGGAAGMSAANQHDFYGYSKYFRDNFSEFRDAHGIRNLCEALYHRYPSREERWAYLAKHGALMYDQPPGQTYVDLHKLIHDKNYFIITTNQDMQFGKLFPQELICYPQGSSHWLQCAEPCHDEVYPSEEAARRMTAGRVGTRVPTELLPRCPVCGGDMEPWFRSPVFLQGRFWQENMDRFQSFIDRHARKRVLLLEFGVGPMTPNIIKYPFNSAVIHWPNAFLARINKGEPPVRPDLSHKALVMDEDIARVLRDLAARLPEPQPALAG